jgi:hypothetical protein
VSHKVVIQAGWNDCGHLSEAAKQEMLAAIPPYQRDARSKGIPDLGAGAVYPISQEDYITDRKPDPSWPRAYGLDVGWNWTHAVWLAWDREAALAIAYDEYYRSAAEPEIHAAAIRSKGVWIPGTIDPSSKGVTPIDGQRLMDMYITLGLNLTKADNAVVAGTTLVWNLLSTGQLKIGRHLLQLLRQMKIYRRDEKGVIIKRDDHGPDALRYDCMTGPSIMCSAPAKLSLESWMGPGSTAGWLG